MSITKGAMLISNANAVGTELVNQLGGTGYKPVEWADKINLLGINSVDAPYAIKSIQAGTYTGEERGAIQYSNCNAVGSMLNKKLNTNRGFKPVEWPSAIKVLKALTENTVTGDICNVPDGAEQVPLKSWSVNIPPTLTGKSTVVCTDTGKNMLDPTKKTEASATVWRFYFDEGLLLKKGTYTISASATMNGIYVRKKADNTDVSVSYNQSYLTFTLSDDLLVTFTFSNVNTWDGVTFQLEVGNQQTAHVSYTAPTVNTVDLGRTVYGADVDVVGGTCGKAITETKTFTGSSDESWLYSEAYGWFYIDNQFGDAYRNNSESNFMICNLGTQSPYVSVTSLQNMHFACTSGTNSRFAFKNSQYSTVEDFKTWLSNNNMVVRYTSATFEPFTFNPITPTPETNTSVNFWNDTGSNTITYYQAPQALTRSTVSGSIASFSDADTRLTCVNAIATIPPSISGVDTVQLVDAGKNLAQVFDDGYVPSTSNGQLVQAFGTRSDYIKVKANTDYVFSLSSSTTTIYFFYYDKDHNYISLNSSSSVQSYTHVTPNDCVYLMLRINSENVTNAQLEEGTTHTTYEAYNATTYTANLPSTNYGGSVDFVNGTVINSGVKYTLDGTQPVTMLNTTDANIKRFSVAIPNDSIVTTTDRDDIVSDDDLPTTTNAVTSAGGKGIHYRLNGSHNVIVCFGSDVSLSSVEEYNAYVSEHNIEIVYTLATPTTASITGQAIIPKTGTNNCYNNVGGNTEITYFTNT